MTGALMVCGTTSDAGKTTLVTALCRVLARRGVSVAPFKAQNMALNSAVTPSGHEIGRAQAAQAAAAGVAPEVAMNPILLKPTSDHSSQVIVSGEPWATLDAAAYHRAKPELLGLVLEYLADLRRRFDVVLCEGAGSPAEINLLDSDIVKLRLALQAGVPAVVVGDIDRGGVFAALYGTVMLLPPELAAIIKGFVINKFRGDPALLSTGPAELARRCGVPTLGVVPMLQGIGIDAEDSLALDGPWAPGAPLPAVDGKMAGASAVGSSVVGGSRASLDVAVIRFPRISNFTDLDPLRLEAGVSVRMVDCAGALARPDLVILPGTKATVADLEWLRTSGLAAGVTALAATPGVTILGMCGGYQMLGTRIVDAVEASHAADVQGLGLLAVRTRFDPAKVTRRVSGRALGHPIAGYEIRHGRTTGAAKSWVELDQVGAVGASGTTIAASRDATSASDGAVLGTSVHGLMEADGFRGAFLAAVARRAGRQWRSSGASFAAAREARFDLLADVVEAHLDMAAVESLIASARPVRRRDPDGALA
ncbi:MAG: cobyric acid synthase [Acidimicrobiales bacterium]